MTSSQTTSDIMTTSGQAPHSLLAVPSAGTCQTSCPPCAKTHTPHQLEPVRHCVQSPVHPHIHHQSEPIRHHVQPPFLIFRSVSSSISHKITHKLTDGHLEHHEFPQQPSTLHDSIWLCMTLFDTARLCRTLYYSVWLRMTLYVSV